MKIRKGFVSNSSTSSFVCLVCGDAEEVEDYCDDPEDSYFYKCENGHVFCSKHATSEIDFYYDDYKGEWNIDALSVPSKYCPICTMKEIQDSDILKWYLSYHMENKEDIKKNLRDAFNNDYNKFQTYLKSLKG